jgi:hypothetical protein
MSQVERKLQAGFTGGICGLVVGVVASALHMQRICPRTSPQAGFFMAVVLGAGSAFRQP